jgi:Domain of unknown function (DUF4189)
MRSSVSNRAFTRPLVWLQAISERMMRSKRWENSSMRAKIWIVLASLAFGVTSTVATRTLAGYGAIAWDGESGKSGWVWDQPTPAEAAAGAVRECGTSACQLVIKPTPFCAALATTASGRSAGAATRRTLDAAWVAARANCEKRNAGECILRVSNCNK